MASLFAADNAEPQLGQHVWNFEINPDGVSYVRISWRGAESFPISRAELHMMISEAEDADAFGYWLFDRAQALTDEVMTEKAIAEGLGGVRGFWIGHQHRIEQIKAEAEG